MQTPGFPFCLCDTDTIYNPNRLAFPSPGIVTVDGELYLQFFITTVPVPFPPQPTICSRADVGKIEWEVGEYPASIWEVALGRKTVQHMPSTQIYMLQHSLRHGLTSKLSDIG